MNNPPTVATEGRKAGWCFGLPMCWRRKFNNYRIKETILNQSSITITNAQTGVTLNYFAFSERFFLSRLQRVHMDVKVNRVLPLVARASKLVAPHFALVAVILEVSFTHWKLVIIIRPLIVFIPVNLQLNDSFVFASCQFTSLRNFTSVFGAVFDCSWVRVGNEWKFHSPLFDIISGAVVWTGMNL